MNQPICCTCHFQDVPSSLLWLPLFSSVYFPPWLKGHLFRLACSVLLWGARDPENKYRWHVWGVLVVHGPHWVCPSSRWCVLPGSTLFSLQDAFPSPKPLRFSGNLQVHRLGWVRVLWPSQVRAARWPGAWLAHCPRWAVHLNHLPGPGRCFPGAPREHHLRVLCLLWGVDLRLWPSWRKSTIQDPRKMWLATGSLLTIWCKMPVSGQDCSSPLSSSSDCCSLPPVGWGQGAGPIHSQLALLWYLLNPLFCEQARLCIRAFYRKVLFFSLSLVIP